MRQLLLVLGMHRSGTSLATRIANLLGWDLGDQLLEPQVDNPTGYWEDADIVRAHDDYFRAIGWLWSQPGDATHIFERQDAIARLDARIETILLGKGQKIVIKDPRICRLLPVWQRVAAKLEIQTYHFLVYRDPREVANSLLRRDGLPLSQSYLLWFRHVYEAERASRGMPRAFVGYDDLLQDWYASMRPVWAALGLEWLEPSTALRAEISSFVQRQLRHHHGGSSVETNALLEDLAWPAYECLQRGGSTGHDVSPTMDQLGRRVGSYDSAYESMRLLWAQSNAELRAEMDTLKQSRSWLITSPLRAIGAWLRTLSSRTRAR